jgi:hypothetical protein
MIARKKVEGEKKRRTDGATKGECGWGGERMGVVGLNGFVFAGAKL